MSGDEPTRGRDPARTYANDSIEVRWEPRLCIHTRNCVRGLGEVFDPEARPWVRVDGADATRIAETILTCPTGALHFRRLDGDTRAAWALYENGRFRFRRTSYDVERAAAKMRSYGEWAEPIVRRIERASG